MRALLRLGNDLHDQPPDPTARKQRLLEGLCRLLRADAGVCIVTHAATPNGDGTLVTLARWGMTDADAEAFAASYPPTPSHAGRSAKGKPRADAAAAGSAAGPVSTADHCVESVLPVAGVKLRACVALFRRPPGPAGFTARESAILDLFHAESAWLYRPDVPLVSPAGMALTPRQRETLQLLLAGHGEKQIAANLRLSPNTVHHYVKAIHRHFKVSSRSELLARWVRK